MQASLAGRGKRIILLSSSTTIIRCRVLLIRRFFRAATAFRRLICHLHLDIKHTVSSIITHHTSQATILRRQHYTYIELPPLYMFPCLLTRDDNDKFGDFVTDSPLAELGHDLLDVGFHLVVGCDCGGLG